MFVLEYFDTPFLSTCFYWSLYFLNSWIGLAIFLGAVAFCEQKPMAGSIPKGAELGLGSIPAWVHEELLLEGDGCRGAFGDLQDLNLLDDFAK